MIQIDIKADDTITNLINIASRFSTPSKILKPIGEEMVNSTKRRFDDERDTNGNRWAKNSPVTLELYGREFGRSLRNKKGSLNKRGQSKLANKKILQGKSGQLAETIQYQMQGETLLVGSPMPYASTQQLGAERGGFGSTRKGAPIPFGRIPPRPFLGLSNDDRAYIVQHLADQFKPMI